MQSKSWLKIWLELEDMSRNLYWWKRTYKQSRWRYR